MDRLAPLPAAPHLMTSDEQHRLLLACASPEGLLIFRDDRLERLTAGYISGAAPGPQGGLFFTRDRQIYRLDPDQARRRCARRPPSAVRPRGWEGFGRRRPAG